MGHDVVAWFAHMTGTWWLLQVLDFFLNYFVLPT